MKIVDLKVTPVAFPDPPLRNSTGVHEPYALRTIVQVYTDDGLVGLGETYGGSVMASQIEGARPAILGEDPYGLERLRLKVGSPRTFGAIEVACLDIIGKATGRPLCDILGGRVRDAVPYSAYLFYKYADEDGKGEVGSAEQMVEQARDFVRNYGFKTLKIKGGVLPPEEEVETFRALREAFGDGYQIRIDPNAIWSVETSIRVIRKIRDCDPEYVEDPTWGIAGMALVRRSVDVPLSTNMCVTDFDHIPESVRAGAVDVILSDHHFWGGMVATKHLAAICASFKLGLSMHSNSHLGISMAAMTHLASSIPNMLYACDTHYPWAEEDLIDGGKLTFNDGCMRVPDGPGLGVRLDEDKLQEFADNFRLRKQLTRDDISEMKKRDPNWLPFRPRW
jgi:glucarate dehydratase